ACRLGSNTEMALQLWHLTCRLSAFQPRASSVMPRNAATRSCSTMPPVAASSLAGLSVPQNGQISFCFAGFQTASPPHAGHANLEIAAVSSMPTGEGLLTQRVSDDPPHAVGLFLHRHRLHHRFPLRKSAAKEEDHEVAWR